MGYPDSCIALPSDATEELLEKLCEEHTAKLRLHIEAQNKEPSLTRTRYDGTVLSACRIYQEHPYSPFRTVKHNTRRTYEAYLKLIEHNVGRRLIRNVTVIDVKHWYGEWRKPVVSVDETGKEIIGQDRVDRAHDAVSMLKTVIYFMSAMRHEDCKQLASELERVKFEKGGARDQELTYQQCAAFIRAAIDLGKKGVIPVDRSLYVAIGVAAQFELMVRQMDIIGEWAPKNANRKLPAGIDVVEMDTESWAGFFTWEKIPGWRWRMKTSKSKYRAGAEFDLSRYSLLLPLLDAVDPSQRTGAIVKGEHNLPVRYRSYVKWFRRIARAAGIPDEVWNMDSRAGGATEAEEAGATLEAIQGALTHSKQGTTLRYLRKRTKKIADVAEARSQAPWRNESDGGTA
jgi:hypothetical protein